MVKCENVEASFNNCTVTDGSDIKDILLYAASADLSTCTIKFDGEQYVVNSASTAETLTTAIASGASYVIAGADINNGSNSVSIESNVVVDMNGKTLTAGGAASKNASVSVYGDYDVTVKDANIVGGSVMAYYGANVVYDGGNFTYNYGQSGRNLFYAASDNDQQAVITIRNVNVEMAGGDGNSYLCAHGNAIIYVESGSFTGKTQGSSNPAFKAVSIGSYVPQIIISGGTFDWDPTAFVAEGCTVTKNGNLWTVSK